MHTSPSPSGDNTPASTTSSPSRDEISQALLDGLMERDPRAPRVALATIRALRRAEQGHVERVAATIDAALALAAHGARSRAAGAPAPRALTELLDDLAPFERAAALHLLAPRGIRETPPDAGAELAQAGASPDATASVCESTPVPPSPCDAVSITPRPAAQDNASLRRWRASRSLRP